MEKIRKGNDIEIRWAIYAGVGIDEVPYDLTGKNLSLFFRNQFGRTEIYDFDTDRHIISFKFLGKDQKHTGTYSIELVENEGREGMHTVDECDAFTLVSHSCETGGESEGRVECIHLQFRSHMSVGFPSSGGGSDIVVDNVLSETSENPVQNKVVTKAINGLKASVNTLYTQVGELGEKVDSYDKAIAEALKKSDAAVETVQTITAQIEELAEHVSDLSEKVYNIEDGFNWTNVL